MTLGLRGARISDKRVFLSKVFHIEKRISVPLARDTRSDRENCLGCSNRGIQSRRPLGETSANASADAGARFTVLIRHKTNVESRLRWGPHRWMNWNRRGRDEWLDGNGLIEISLLAACSRAAPRRGHGQVCRREIRVRMHYAPRSPSRLHVSPTRPYAPWCAWIYAHDARRRGALQTSSLTQIRAGHTFSDIELRYTGEPEAARDA